MLRCFRIIAQCVIALFSLSLHGCYQLLVALTAPIELVSSSPPRDQGDYPRGAAQRVKRKREREGDKKTRRQHERRDESRRETWQATHAKEPQTTDGRTDKTRRATDNTSQGPRASSPDTHPTHPLAVCCSYWPHAPPTKRQRGIVSIHGDKRVREPLKKKKQRKETEKERERGKAQDNPRNATAPRGYKGAPGCKRNHLLPAPPRTTTAGANDQ